MSMKICEECGSEVSNSAKTCPKCGKKLKSNVLGMVVGFIILSVIVVVIAVGVNSISSEDISLGDMIDTITDGVSDTSSGKKKSNKITLKKFNKIKTGMTYEEVVEIIGEEGTTLAESDITGDGEYHTVMYYWYAEDGISNANVTIQRGKVISKAQVGLD